MKLRNKIIATLATPLLVLTGLALGTGTASAQNTDSAFIMYLYVAPVLALHTNGQNKLLDVRDTSYNFIIHQIPGDPTGYYTIRTTNGHLIFENKSRNVEEGAVRNPSDPAGGETWVLQDGPGSSYAWYNLRSQGYMGVWGRNPGPPSSGSTVRVRAPQTNWYDHWTLFPQSKHQSAPATHGRYRG